MTMRLEEPMGGRDDFSALVDGELSPDGLAAACTRWRDDPAARATWHSYQLIGDVLRSEDLASDADHDAAFLTAFRARLIQEPVVLAPLALPASAPEPARRGRPSWRAYSAVAAGFVAVAGVVVVMQAPLTAPTAVDQPMAAGALSAPTPARPVQTVAALPPPVATPANPAARPAAAGLDGPVLRDASLDQYLVAHKRFSGSSALGVPSTFLRSATVEVPRR